ncbi:glycosyltransferase [Candidatus Pelagibacter sp.]|nr:glycosyltransferase [Candidatus Pelagibacter sp.]
MNSIGIVIPAYNESENIVRLIKKIRNNLNCLIIIVDDSSDLKTKNIITKNKLRNIKYFNRGKKLGRGSAVIFGFKKIINIKKNISCLIEMDADLSHNPSELKRNIKYFDNNSLDLLIGSRYLNGSKIINWPISRRILSKMSNTLARVLIGVPINDYTNGFRFYSKTAAKTIIAKCNNTKGGFIILSEIILILWSKNLKISEIKSIFRNRVRGESTVNINLIIGSLIGLIKLYLLKRKFSKK